MKRYLVPFCMFVLSVGMALPVLASEKVNTNTGSKAIQAELKLMAERAPQTVCPLSGKKINEGKSVTFMGYEIGVCCDKCLAKVKKDPLSAILKLRQKGQEPKLAAGFKKQSTCPGSGKAIAEGVFKVKDNILMSFCCPKCGKGFIKDPKATAQKMLDKKEAPTLITLEQKLCPVSREAIAKGFSVVYKGKKVELCCADCKVAFNKTPARYMQILADKGVVLPEAN